MCFVPQFTAATGIITLESLIFPMRFCVGLLYKKIIVSSSNNIVYIQIHHLSQQTMLNQTLYYTMQYLEPNTKSNGVIIPLGSRCRKKLLGSLKVKECRYHK